MERRLAAIEPELSGAERERARRKLPESLDAWASYHRGMWHAYRVSTEDANAAEAMFRRALAIEPHFAPALAGIAYVAFERVLFFDLTGAREEALRRGLADARAAVALDNRDAFAHYVLGRILTLLGQSDEAIAELHSAIDLNPNFAQAHHGLASAFNGVDRAAEAVEEADKAIRLSPLDPHRWAFFTVRGVASLNLRDCDSAVEWT